jgi:hypothetical protein
MGVPVITGQFIEFFTGFKAVALPAALVPLTPAAFTDLTERIAPA